MRGLPAMVVGLVAAGLAACQAPPAETTEAEGKPREAVALAPLPELPFELGYEWSGLRNGKLYLLTVVARTPETVTMLDSEGCSYVRPDDMFSPSLAWTRCELAPDGEQEITRQGEIWPLRVGKAWSYSYRGWRDRGSPWRGTRRCAVEGSEVIETRLGTKAVYEVVCRDPANVRRWYISPELNEVVRFEWDKTRQGELYVYELTATP